ncbi:hypothetical protein GCM10007874_55990 [Labrys miyagiensis]|uniref:VWFA domain-containing protein n=1 Tax=Labrys miyagiensis TaxID=346912 RepID=A0ABQ6CWH4_9HYPH|nr:VWA domain-containing protein [Labrys miyagiensis]GLS22581.1 hypothetical protein GCM10007874_55990 [Labrys miyagiensis]
MSVDHDFDPVELPEARPSDAAREQAIFKAVMQFEENQRRQSRGVPQPRLRFSSLLPRPSLRLALATGAAALIAIPMGVETMKTWRPAETLQEVEVPSTDQKLAINDSTPAPPLADREKLPATQKPVELAGHNDLQKSAVPPAPPKRYPVEPAAQIAPLPAPPPLGVPTASIAPEQQMASRAVPLPPERPLLPNGSAPAKQDQAWLNVRREPVGGAQAPDVIVGQQTGAPAQAGASPYPPQPGTGGFGSLRIDPNGALATGPAAGEPARAANTPAPAPTFMWDPNVPKAGRASPSGTANLLAGTQQIGGGFSATLSIEDGRSSSTGNYLGGLQVGGKTGTAEKLVAGQDVAPVSPAVSVATNAPAPAAVNSIDAPMPPPQAEVGRDKFANAPENAFKPVAQEPVSTFSIDVDTASYSYVRAALGQNVLPQPDAVRTEEMINYFPYDYAPPRSAAEPFSTAVTVMPNPWVAGHKLMRIGIKGYTLPADERPPANLVFLIDTSGSMDEPNKLPLLLKSLGMLVDTLRPEDKVSIVAYAGSAGVVLPPTKASDKAAIEAALDRLNAGGSTAGGEGLRLAYQLAEANFDPKAVNRVMLSTDGDFNVGITDPDELKGFVTRERDKGIFLSVLGFGMGNLNDAMMQELAQNGNGEAAYIDTLNEARKVLVDQATSTLFPIAKDVKIQVEFNPAAVSDYRLVGYETRMLRTEDFNNDKVDAGEVGSGTSVTAIYDFVPAGGPRPVDDSRYQAQVAAAATGKADEYAFLKIRYKLPKSDKSKLMTTPVTRAGEAESMSQAPLDSRFAVAVASFGEWLRGGKYSGSVTPDDIIALANGAKGEDEFGYRAEFINLVRAAKTAKGLPPSRQ